MFIKQLQEEILIIGQKIDRVRAGISLGTNVILALTLHKTVKLVPNVETPLEAEMRANTAAMGDAIPATSASNSSTQPLNEDESIPGRVKSRINVANGRTRFTPLRESTGNPVSAGFNHVVEGHFNRPLGNSRSIFSITEEQLKNLLNSKQVINSPITPIKGGQFVRTVDVGENIGNVGLREGGGTTSSLQVITDKAGNLITTYPVKKQ